MGLIKNQWIEKNNETETRIADILGITVFDLNKSEWTIDTEESEDGFIYNYVIQFKEGTPKEILEKIKGLDENNQVWIPQFELYDFEYEDEYEAIITKNDFYNEFLKETQNIFRLNQIKIIDIDLNSAMKRQLFIAVITSLETFLSETIISFINKDEKILRSFVESYPSLKSRKIKFNNIFGEYDRIRITVNTELFKISYHNLSVVRNLYKNTINIDFPEISEIMKAVNIRHDLVHRNGKTKEGGNIKIDNSTIENLINQVISFVESIQKKIEISQQKRDITLKSDQTK